MHYFQYSRRELHAENLPLSRLVKSVGTPSYIYSYQTLVRHFQIFDGAFSTLPHLTCYSVKANSNLALLRIFSRLGGGFDIVSQGELARALQAGADPRRIVFSGVGKTETELAAAVRAGVMLINVESLPELLLLSRVAKRWKRRVRISFRLNPDISAESHPYLTTGTPENKFGIDIKEALSVYRRAARLPFLEPAGIDCHIGSQITSLKPFVAVLRKLKSLISRLGRLGIDISFLDLGGGLGITYRNETPPHPDEYARVIEKELRGFTGSPSGITLILEPGRVIVGNAGILVARVLYTKKVGRKEFVITDAGMNDLIRPALYDSFHDIIPVRPRKGPRKKVDVVGPICESGDFFARDRKLPPLRSGDLLAIMGAGAYGFSMSSNYNSRPRAAEVLVRGNRFAVIRRRENQEDLTRGETIPASLLK